MQIRITNQLPSLRFYFLFAGPVLTSTYSRFSTVTSVYFSTSELEATYSGKSIVLVSHADTLQITQTYIAGGADPRLFAQYRFRNGEVSG